jgi:hypothetical protein
MIKLADLHMAIVSIAFSAPLPKALLFIDQSSAICMLQMDFGT